MKISIFGLGYVGAVSGACLAELGHEVIGVDVSAHKIDMINRGEAPIVEQTIAELTSNAVGSGRLRATSDGANAVLSTQASLISVGTPTGRNGAPDISHVEQVVREIGAALRDNDHAHTVIIRSTVPPGATMGRLAPMLEEAAREKLVTASISPSIRNSCARVNPSRISKIRHSRLSARFRRVRKKL